MHRVAWFGDIVTFYQLWQTLPAASLQNFFFDREQNRVPIYQVHGGTETKRVNTISVFQAGVKPNYEDAINSAGSELQFFLQLPQG